MKIRTFLRYLSIEPVQLKAGEKLIVASACLVAIFLTAIVTSYFVSANAPILLASMGASAVILFVIPGSPLAQPWPFVGGQMLSALIGCATHYYVDDVAIAPALAVGLSVLAMLMLRCLHPPGAATALVPVLNGANHILSGPDFLLMPVGVNVALLMILTLLINRWVLGRDYPSAVFAREVYHSGQNLQGDLVGIDLRDIEQATSECQHFVDVSADELCQIFTRLQLLSFQKNFGALSCADILQGDVVCVEYATEVETAWQLMHENHLAVLVVLDRAQHVIGIVTRYDFLKNLKLTPHQSFQEKWLAFIKRSPELTTDKPEAIGHIMTRKVKTLKATAHIAELLVLMVNEGHHQVPIVNEDGRFMGMVFQNRLLSALFNQQAFNRSKPTGGSNF